MQESQTSLFDKPAAPAKKKSSSQPGRDIKAMLKSHAEWLESGQRKGKRANFHGMDLTAQDFSEANLAEADLHGANLSGVNFTGANLAGADLADAKLAKSNLRGAVLARANLARADLTGSDAGGCDATEADFSEAQLAECNFEEAKLASAMLRDANLRHTNLRHTQLKGAMLRGALLMDAQLQGADLTGADLRDADCARVVLAGANLENAHFRDANLRDVDFSRVNFLRALEVSSEFHLQVFLDEYGRIRREREALDLIRSQLDASAKQLEARKLLVTEWDRKEKQFIMSSAAHEVWMRYYLGFWGIITALLLGLTIYEVARIPIEHLKLTQIALVLSGLLFVSTLFTASTWRVHAVMKMLRHHKGFCREQVRTLQALSPLHLTTTHAKASVPASSPAAAPAAASAKTRK